MGWRLASLAPLLVIVACNAPPSPSAPTPLPPISNPPVARPVPAGRPGSLLPTGLTSLGDCNAAPNYFVDDVTLFRRERLPLLAWISNDEETTRYLAGIRKGLTIWGTATRGLVTVSETADRSAADVTIAVDPYPVYDCRQYRWYGIFAEPQRLDPRLIRGGGIHICPDNFAATPVQVSRIAKLIGHELGHALGIGGHSTVFEDVMYENDIGVVAPDDQFPWVSQRDINTLTIAYCN